MKDPEADLVKALMERNLLTALIDVSTRAIPQYRLVKSKRHGPQRRPITEEERLFIDRCQEGTLH
jgi:hypothetical protein